MPDDAPKDYMIFNSYTYNQNSQTKSSKFDPIKLSHTYTYDSRNRITSFSCDSKDLFSYNLTYYSNSNIQTQSFTGDYKNSFSNRDNLSVSYTYDKSNRLLKANYTNTSDNTFDLINTYDPDGNILTLQRYGSNNNLIDNFSNEYYTGTNKLKNLTGSGEQYNYDYNGNMTNDNFAENYGITYDHRNLITEITRTSGIIYPPLTTKIRYKYDEAGNRTRKTMYQTQDEFPSPITSDDTPTGWTIILDEYYARDATGKEIAIYSSYTLQYWNVWSGGEITGRINYSESLGRNYYLKDHLGTIRVVLDEDKAILSANDLDMWGYYLQDRTYSTTNTKNKFTGKERDQESSYDYFGARYYNSRIGRWGQVESLLDKYISYSPYVYSLVNPIKILDINGKDVIVSGEQSKRVIEELNSKTKLNIEIDKNGKLTASGKPENQMEYVLLQAIKSKNITVNLNTTSDNSVNYNSDKFDLLVGAYLGSKTNDNGIIIATQFINLLHADTWEEAGGSDVANTILHEINEAFIGACLNPGVNSLNSSDNEFKNALDKTHGVIKDIFEEKQFYPSVGKSSDDKTIYLINKKNQPIKVYEK